jgi:hypothetical protein
MDSSSRIKYLLHVFLNCLATPAERAELFALINKAGNEETVKELIGDEMRGLELEMTEPGSAREEGPISDERANEILATILGREKEGELADTGEEGEAVIRTIEMVPGWSLFGLPWVRMKWVGRVAASVLIILAGLGGYRRLTESHGDHHAHTAQRLSNDVPPGGNRAVLILANGSRIILDSAHMGKLTQQGVASVVKLDSGKLAYVAPANDPGEVYYNMLKTPRGGQFQLVLPDSSKVWLSAASSIRYPTVFTGHERSVEITGEAYFEVTKKKDRPFVVKAGPTTTLVLGTSFNINAYEDEKDLKITLVDGAVKVIAEDGDRELRPGQQALLRDAGGSLVVQEADVYQAIAWKNGQFDFDRTDLPAIMRQISRWYDVDINYQSTNDTTRFGGGISRQLTLSNVLRLLDKSGVHTRLEGKKIIVLP